MADFDSFNYDIKSKLPEWWKNDGFLAPVNNYTQELIAGMLEALLSSTGVVQPLNCWLTIPEEYTWYHHYMQGDELLLDEGHMITNGATKTLFPTNTKIALLPNTKRNCHAKIQLKLFGNELDEHEVNENGDSSTFSSEKIKKLTLENAGQKIIFQNIPSTSTIEISTKDDEILIDGEYRDDLIIGTFNKIRPTIKYDNYMEPYIDNDTFIPAKITNITFTEGKNISLNLKNQEIYIAKTRNKNQKHDIYFLYENGEIFETQFSLDSDSAGDYPFYMNNIEVGTINIERTGEDETDLTIYKHIDIENENKKTQISIKLDDDDKKVNFDLQIYLYKPTYTTEQNIRIVSVSAFPIESVTLYGYFCHRFNDQQGYKELWSKKYTKNSRTVYDRISTQYDCEKFYVVVKFHGIGFPLKKGFPQEIGNPDKTFQLNPNLDKWGKVYGLPRRHYKPNITEDEEPYTFPKYYKYPIEQDYWYEERMVNEYQYDADAVNSLFVRDNEFNNIGMLECIYPFSNNIWVYTETINPSFNITDSEKEIQINKVSEANEEYRASWDNLDTFPEKPLISKLEPYPKNKTYDNLLYQTRKLYCSFCLRDFESQIPDNIKIKGIELKLQTEIGIQSGKIKLSEDSKVIIPYIHKNADKEYEPILEKINILQGREILMKEKGYYTIGSPTNLFGEKEITREQLFYGNDGKLDFELIFENENNFLETILYIKNIWVNIYYEFEKKDYDINVKLDKQEIFLSDEDPEINVKIVLSNKSNSQIKNKELFIIIPPELEFKNEYNGVKFNLDVGEVIDDISIPIKPKLINNQFKTGRYDIIVFCEDKIIPNEVTVRRWKTDDT